MIIIEIQLFCHLSSKKKKVQKQINKRKSHTEHDDSEEMTLVNNVIEPGIQYLLMQLTLRGYNIIQF